MKVLWQKRIILLLLIVGALTWLWGVNYPFVGTYNANNNYLSLAAKNYLRFGFWNLKFFPTYFAGAHFIPGDPYYLHHPILVYWMEALSIFMLGAKNWVIHLPHLLFSIGSMGMLYLIGKKLWNKSVALWSLGLAVIFPMTGFFWKYMLFEQECLFFNLVVYYFIILSIQKPNRRYLLPIFLASFLSGLTDWGVLYLLLPFSIFFFTKFRKQIWPAIFSYVAGAGVSLGLFLAGVLFLQKSFGELSLAIWTRSFTVELTGLSYWPIRLFIVSVIRTILYFSPFAVVSVIYVVKLIAHRDSWKLPDVTLIFFFLVGLLNVIFLPTTTWGHSYFLYYFIPFFAWTGGLWLERREKKSWVICFWVIVIIVSSIAVNYFKIQQVKKQIWKYDAAVQINTKLAIFETIGVINFPGDVFENYFFHPSQPIPFARLSPWTKGETYPGVRRAVFVCAGSCTVGELLEVDRLTRDAQVEPYTIGQNSAWLVTKQLHKPRTSQTGNTPIPKTSTKEENIFLQWYRSIRDALNVGQI